MKFNCIRCNKEIVELYPDIFKNKDKKLSSRMWNGGLVTEIDGNYGSDHDGDVYIIAICDKCIDILGKKNKIIYHSNYLNSDESWKDFEKGYYVKKEEIEVHME